MRNKNAIIRRSQPSGEMLRIIPLERALSKFERTGTADIAVGRRYGICVKDEGDFVSVRFGTKELTPVGSGLSGERNFATKQQVFDFAEQIQKLLAHPNKPQR